MSSNCRCLFNFRALKLSMSKISAAIITFNEEKNIERCITSLLEVADEIVIVDSGSTDETVDIAIKLGAKVIEHPFEGHIQQKNYAITQTRFDWVLSLDADEALSETLKISILANKDQLSFDAYEFNRLTNYCGKWIKHCGWYPDKKIRLFKKGSGKWGGKNPHDKFILNQPKNKKHLKGDLLHYTFYKVEEHRAQIDRFTTIAAQSLFELGKQSNWFKIIGKTIFKFIRNYILKAGFLDGIEGFQICRLSAYATYLRYYKLLNLQRKDG